MARKVRISTVGPRPFSYAPGASARELTQQAIAHLGGWLDKVLPDKPDFVVFPEAGDRPAGIGREACRAYYAERGLEVHEYMQRRAREEGVNIAFSACMDLGEGLSNCISFIGRDGNVRGVYSKNFLVTEENTQSGIRYGTRQPIIEMDFGRVGGVICFDLNFDELKRRYAQAKPELLVFSSMYHGGFVQQSWAYDCRSYFVGAAAGLPCTVINPVGEIVAQSTNYYPYVTCTVNLDYAVVHLDHHWEKLDALRAKYRDAVTVHDPGYLGAVLITSETGEVSVRQMMEEFAICPLDDYLNASRRYRQMVLDEEP